jgi:hypothetical protein
MKQYTVRTRGFLHDKYKTYYETEEPKEKVFTNFTDEDKKGLAFHLLLFLLIAIAFIPVLCLFSIIQFILVIFGGAR